MYLKIRFVNINLNFILSDIYIENNVKGGQNMNNLIKSSKYIHIIYYVIALFIYVDLILIMFAPTLQMGIVGTGCLLATIPGILSTFLLIKEKSFIIFTP